MPTLARLLAPIRVSTRNHGVFLLRTISVGDADFIATLRQQPHTDVEFAARVLHHHLVEPRLTLDQMSALPSGVLAHIGRVWLRKGQGTLLDTTVPPLIAFRHSCPPHEGELGTSTGQGVLPALTTLNRGTLAWLLNATQALKLQTNVGPLLSNLMRLSQVGAQPAQQALPSLLSSLTAPWRTSAAQQSLWYSLTALSERLAAQQSLPSVLRSLMTMPGFPPAQQALPSVLSSLTESILKSIQRQIEFAGLLKRWEELHQKISVFEESDYGFVAHLLPVSMIVRLASVDPRVRHAVTTRKLQPYTRSAEFEDQLELLFQQSPRLRRRWGIVQNGLRCHQRGDYVGSVRILMPEVDGIYGDMLLVRKRAVERQERLYALDEFGKPKLNVKRKHQALDGLHGLVNHYDFSDHPVMERVAQHIKRSFTSDRNPTLHGRRIAYDKPMLSLQIVLLLFVLAQEFMPEGFPSLEDDPNYADHG